MPPRSCPQARDPIRSSSWPPLPAASSRPSVDPERAILVVELAHLSLREVPRLLQHLALLAHDRAGQTHQRCCRGECLHCHRPALYLAFVRSWTLLVARGRVAIEGEGPRGGLTAGSRTRKPTRPCRGRSRRRGGVRRCVRPSLMLLFCIQLSGRT